MIIQHVECPTCGRTKEYEVQERLADLVVRLMFGGKFTEHEWYEEECYTCESDYDEYLFSLARGEEETDPAREAKDELYSWLYEGEEDEENALPF